MSRRAAHLTDALALACAALLACGGRGAGSATSPTTTPAAAAAPRPAPGGAPPLADGTPAISDDECTQLADHLVDVSMMEKRSAHAEQYTEADAETAKRELRQALRPACATLSRRELSCALAAGSSGELRACK